MPELLLELGCEELPASFVRKAYGDLEAAVVGRLKQAGIGHGVSRSMGTPRRLIVQVQGLADRQPDMQKEQRGPGLTAAYDSSGNPTKALEGFCRSQGISVDELRKEGDYVWVSKTIPGKPTAEVLESLLPEAIRSLNFEKSMRWGGLKTRFARPVRWILAAFNGMSVQFDIDGIQAGLESRGHRFNFPDTFESTTFDHLVGSLRSRQVEPDPGERELRIRSGALAVAGGKPDMADTLVDENVFLTEWPTAVEGSFRAEYLELPVPVLVTAMAKHEKFFPVRDGDGQLTNRFVSIRNGGVDDVVSEGNAWVLNARFNDAKFFFDEDRKHSLQDFLEQTKGIVFQDKLGTVHQRAYRLAELARKVALSTGADSNEQELAEKAALYSKADLPAGLVSELPALQGLIGSEYAMREGMPEAVCWAIASHYDLAKNLTIDSESARTAVRLSIADQLDKLAGYLGIGQAPSGSSDPYGLRRAATLLIEAALRWPAGFGGYKELFEQAQEGYREQGIEVAPGLIQFADIFRSRYDSIFAEARHDILEAALLDDYVADWAVLDPKGVKRRIKIMEFLASDTAVVQTATRSLNIVSQAVRNGIPFDYDNPFGHMDRIESASGEKLGATASEVKRDLKTFKRYIDHLTWGASETAPHVIVGLGLQLRPLMAPTNDFFDSTMIMTDDAEVRYARLSLLHGVNLILREAGDFSKVVMQG